MVQFALLPVIFRRRRWPAIATFVSVFGGALIYLFTTPRLYEATVRLILDDNPVSLSEIGHDISTQVDTPYASPIATQAQLARSRSVLQPAFDQVFPQGTQGSTKSKKMFKQLQKGLKVTIIPGTQILDLKDQSQDPALTARLLNAVAKAMVEENAETIRLQARAARDFLETEVPKKRANLAEAEAMLAQYRKSQGIVSTNAIGQDSTQTQSLVATLASLEDEQRALFAQLQQVNASNNSLQGTTDSGTLKNTYAAVRSGQDEELKRLREELANLDSDVTVSRTRLTDNNPVLLKLIERRNAMRTLYAQKLSHLLPNSTSNNRPTNIASDQVSQDLATKLILGKIERSGLEAKLGVVRRQIAQLQARLNQVPGRQEVLAELTRQQQEAASSLELLERKLDEARIAQSQLVSNLRIIDPAVPPIKPSWPNQKVVLVIATVVGTILATGVVLLLELLDGTLRNATEAKELVKLPILGVLPALPKTSLTLENKQFLNNPALLESYRTLLKSMECRSVGNLRVVVVSSTVSGEGKSVVVSHLAVVSAMLSRRTLIIDADLRRPTQHKIFNIRAQSGLTDVIDGRVNFALVVQPTNISNLWVLTCGKPHVYPSRLLESESMLSLLAEAAANYDLVIVDTPPVTSCVDALTLSRDSDRLLLVARPNFTQKDILLRAVSELTSNRIGILGVAINGITNQTEKFYQYALQDYQPLKRSHL